MPKPDEPTAGGAPDWAPGDRALCIDDDWRNVFAGQNLAGPAKGTVHVVTDVREYGFAPNHPFLSLQSYPRYVWFSHANFTKLNPLSDDEKREFEADLRHDERVGEHVMYLRTFDPKYLGKRHRPAVLQPWQRPFWRY